VKNNVMMGEKGKGLTQEVQLMQHMGIAGLEDPKVGTNGSLRGRRRGAQGFYLSSRRPFIPMSSTTHPFPFTCGTPLASSKESRMCLGENTSLCL